MKTVEFSIYAAAMLAVAGLVTVTVPAMARASAPDVRSVDVAPAASAQARAARGIPNARRRSSRRPNRLYAYAFVSSYYDDNVFDYSDADRAQFQSATVPLSRFPISNLSDVVTNVSGRLNYLWNARRRSNWRARLSYNGHFYTNNGEKTYHEFEGSLRRKKRRGLVELAVGITPDYYLRHLYWRGSLGPPPGVKYAPASMARYVVALRGRRRLSRRWAIDVRGRFARRNYAAPFDERDNSTWTIGAGPVVRVSRRVEVDGRLALGFSSAAGANSTDPAAADISNNRLTVRTGMTWRMSRRVRLEEGVGYSHQRYTTGRVTDTYHYNRKDDEYWWHNELTLPRQGKVQPKVFFNYRRSSTTTEPGVADVGQYTGSRFGAQLTMYL